MTTLIFFLAGVSLGLVTDKLYNLVTNNTQSEADKPSQTEDIPIEVKVRHDDLSQLKGVGPKLAIALNEAGIYNYEQLSTTSVDVLLEQLSVTGGKFSRSVIESIVGRAQLAANE